MKRFPLRSACLLLAFGLGLLAASGCATLGAARKVDVSVVDIRPTQAAMLETTAVLTLRLTNDSPEGLTLKGSSSRLYLNGTSLGRGVSNDAITLPALGTATMQVTVYLENLTLVRKASEFSRSPNSISYRLETQLFSNEAGGNRTLRATTEGQLDITELLASVGTIAR